MRIVSSNTERGEKAANEDLLNIGAGAANLIP
jgi:hypothetical protein